MVPCCLNLMALYQVCWSLFCVTPDKCLWGKNVNPIPQRLGERRGPEERGGLGTGSAAAIVGPRGQGWKTRRFLLRCFHLT